MTNKEKSVEMFRMYLDGYSYTDIGKKFGITRQAVEQRLNPSYYRKARTIASCVYPNIRKWLRESGSSFRGLAAEMGYELGGGTPPSITDMLRGKRELRASDIKKLSYITGLTYEQIMERDDVESDNQED